MSSQEEQARLAGTSSTCTLLVPRAGTESEWQGLMQDEDKTKQQLLVELRELRAQLASATMSLSEQAPYPPSHSETAQASEPRAMDRRADVATDAASDGRPAPSTGHYPSRQTSSIVTRNTVRTLIEAIPDAVIISDRHGAIVRTNEQGQRLYDLPLRPTAEEVAAMRQRCHFAYPDGTPLPAEDLPLACAMRGETLTDAHLVLHRRDMDQPIHLLVSAAPLREEDGSLTGAVSITRDLTEIYRLQQLKDEFLVVAAHELRTPLTSLKILAQLTYRRLTRANIPEASQLAGMDQSISRIERIINDLVDVSRIQEGHLTLRRERVDFASLCKDPAEELEDATERSITRQLPASPLWIFADPERVHQVLTNLLANALKYSPVQSPVTLSAEVVGDEVVVSVADQGGGIPAAELEHLFDRFYRVPGVQVQVGSGVGLGLGLYICREIVERHGGRIWVESEIGEGSTFRFTLPRAAEEA